MKKLLILSTFLFQQLWASDLTFKTKCDFKNQNATLAFVGDILIHKPLYLSVVNESSHFSQIWKETIPSLSKADLRVANLEGPSALGIDRAGHDHGDVGFIYDDQVYSGTNYVFNYHPRIMEDLKLSGFNLLTLANNHAMDRFSIGIDKTIMAARAINLPTVGTKKSDESNADYFKIMQIKNIAIAFIGCTEVTNDPDTKNQILHCESDKTIQLIKELSIRSDVDAIVVLPHWGVEYSPTPKDYQRDYAHKFFEAGADIIVGSHPHVLEPWEKYVTKNGRETVIMYSLGNFVAHQGGLDKQTGAITYVGLSKNGNEKAKIFGVAYTPTYRIYNHIRPISSSGNTDVLKLASTMFGKKGLTNPEDSLFKIMCPNF